MSRDPTDPVVVTDHDRRRLRAARSTALAGAVIGVVAAGILAVLGASGAAGAAVVFTLSAAGSVAAALVTAILAIVDEVRRRPVARRRIYVTFGYFLGGVTLLLMGIGASASGLSEL